MTAVNYRPYPRVDRSMDQLDRHAYERQPLAPAPEQFRADILRAFRVPPRLLGMHFYEHPRRAGKTGIVQAIVDRAVADGEHVHTNGRDGERCHGGDPACTASRTEKR